MAALPWYLCCESTKVDGKYFIITVKVTKLGKYYLLLKALFEKISHSWR